MKILFKSNTDHLPASTNIYSGLKKNDPNDRNTYFHHYCLGIHGQFFDDKFSDSLLRYTGLLFLQELQEGLSTYCFCLDVLKLLSQAHPKHHRDIDI